MKVRSSVVAKKPTGSGSTPRSPGEGPTSGGPGRHRFGDGEKTTIMPLADLLRHRDQDAPDEPRDDTDVKHGTDIRGELQGRTRPPSVSQRPKSGFMRQAPPA